MEGITKIIFWLLLTIPTYFVSCSECEDCDPTTWTEEFHIANNTNMTVSLTEKNGKSHTITPHDSLIIKIDNITGFQYMGHKPFESLFSIKFNDSVSNNFTITNDFDLNNDENYVLIGSSTNYYVYRYEVTIDDYNFALKQSQKE